MIVGGFWSAYWYHGRIYGTEIVRGLDVLELIPTEYLTENEIEAATLADQGAVFNPQQQFPVTWPAHPSVALAYVDQLERASAIPEELIGDLRSALGRASRRLGRERADAELADGLEALAGDVGRLSVDATNSERSSALQRTLHGVAASVRDLR
jgi:hypothetical protein